MACVDVARKPNERSICRRRLTDTRWSDGERTAAVRDLRTAGEITFARRGTGERVVSEALEKGLRSERALALALAEMCMQGVSTREVQAITEQMCGVNISSSLFSQAAAQLDEELAKWRERPLGE